MSESTKRPNFLELRDLAAEVATQAAHQIRVERQRFVDTDGLAAHSTTKSSAVDPVTEVDTMSERFIVDSLLQARPHDGVLGEEGADKPSETGVTWIVDPIDGTVNFLYGIEEYAVSIGAAYEGELVAGVVVNVSRGIVYQAAKGHGATVTYPEQAPQPLRCSGAQATTTALVATGFGYAATRRSAQAELLTRILPHVRDIRRMGAAALDLCRLAEGTVDAYYEHGIHAWDYAAGAVIAREAGVILAEPGLERSGTEGNIVYGAAAALFPRFKELLAEAGALNAIPVT